MKIIFRIAAIFNLLLSVLAFIFVVIAAINKNGNFLIVSTLMLLVSIFPTAMMLALCNDFKEGGK